MKGTAENIFHANRSSSTSQFTTIKLKEIDKVKLMDRTDRKFWFNSDLLPSILKSIQEDYFVLCIDGQTKLNYATQYYDTKQDKMFSAHHNGKLNRFKVRKRTYVSSGISFLEIKFKNNKGRTIKQRIPSLGNAEFSSEENTFLATNTPFQSNELQPSLMNEFSRITLVNKNFKERCTIDTNLRFRTENNTISIDNLAIVEIKAEGHSTASPIAKALQEQRIKTSGFSKYCIGRTLTDSNVKRNAFKPKIRRLEKVLQASGNLY